MSSYTPPQKDILFAVQHLSGLDDALGLEIFGDFDREVIAQVISEAGKFAAEVVAPINSPGDRHGASFDDGEIHVAPGYEEAYAQFVENGWQGLTVSPEYDGMGMPEVVGVAAVEAFQTASLSFSLLPMLTSGAITAIQAHASAQICNTYLPRMANGEWSGTMNLTEPQAGSDLSRVATRAEPEGDHYRLTGTKIFITWGDHSIAENIVSLVLARLPDAPDGVRGISLFLVPKFLVNTDGSLGERNDVHVASIEEKLGIHASPTCVMNFGDNDGAIGYLVGEENNGLACMFTMMNHARIEVGVQGLAISERAYQAARTYAKERIQGKLPGIKDRVSIIHHADVRRMLLVMKSQIEAMRAVAYAAAGVQSIAHHHTDPAVRKATSTRLALLTPVIKGWMTEVAQEVTSLGVQIHGGMGFVEETGAAQHLRDARILTIYEGTTGIQAGDFTGRKILSDSGAEIRALVDEMQRFDGDLEGDKRLERIRVALAAGVASLDEAITWLLETSEKDHHVAGTASVNLLMLAGTVIGGWQLARGALAVTRGAVDDDVDFGEQKIATADFYAAHIMPRATSLCAAATADAGLTMSMPEDAF